MTDWDVERGEPAAGLTDAQFALLVDYVGGALVGTADHDRVTRWVAADPLWRDAHESLRHGTAAVESALRSWGAEPEPMPVDVTERLMAALAAAPPLAGTDATPTAPIVPIGAARRRRRITPLRWAAAGAVAASVAAFGGFVMVAQPEPNDQQPSTFAAPNATPATTETTADAGVAPRFGELPAGLLAQASGRAYRADNLADAGQAVRGATTFATAEVAPPLRRLASAGGMENCVRALAAIVAPGATATGVDFATFDGRPAAVLALAGPDGRLVAAVGPDCGLAATGADLRATAPLS
ncbi:hypothetical protein [Pilimelia columellifera]|uniref:Anti-sigma factor n=1 Tax=Pilimelia columellifera subsp. columellifera TaxID=706583 RepID=A0ABN3MZV3_9ACTN